MIRKTSLSLLISGLILLSWLPFVDDFGDRYTTKALTQATVTYGISRGINSVVSVLQSTEVSIGIASVSPGEFLDPLNDLIERFSWIMMMAMASRLTSSICLSAHCSMVSQSSSPSLCMGSPVLLSNRTG